MNFKQQYLEATRAFDTKSYVQAVGIYMDLLTHSKDRILAMNRDHESARITHNEMAIQYAFQKTLIQRIRSNEKIFIDLSPFSISLPFQIRYGAGSRDFLESWKDGSPTFSKNMEVAQERYDLINATKMNGQFPKTVIPADVYAAIWVVTDLLDLEPHLPQNVSGYVSLGCGCGIYDSTYLKTVPDTVQATVIDIDKHTGAAVNHVSTLNNLANMSFSPSWDTAQTPPNFVLSIRSCGFLYDVQEYDSLFSSLQPGSRVLLDVANARVEDTNAYFKSLGASTQTHPRISDAVKLIEYRL